MPWFNLKQNTNSVGLWGDGDEIELIQYFETTFAISFSNEEAEQIYTLGDAYSLICSKLPKKSERTEKCLTAMAYYKVNRALCENGKLPTQSLVALPEGQTPKSFQNMLEERSGLKLPFLSRASLWVDILFFLQFITWIIAPIFWSGGQATLIGLCIAAASHTVWRVANNADNRVLTFHGTVEDLSRLASEQNIGTLISQGGTWKASDVWWIMTSLIQECTGYSARDMTPEMKFI